MLERLLGNSSSLFFAAIVAVTPNVAFASDGAPLMFFWINFLLYCFVIFMIVRKPFALFWQRRRDEIQTAVEAGARELEQAETRLNEARDQFARLDADIVELRKSIESDGEKEAAAIATEATARSERVSSQANDSIAGEQRAMEVSLRKELAETVIEKAQQKLSNEITPDHDSKLRGAALEGMSSFLQ